MPYLKGSYSLIGKHGSHSGTLFGGAISSTLYSGILLGSTQGYRMRIKGSSMQDKGLIILSL